MEKVWGLMGFLGSQGHAGNRENDVKEIGNPSSGNFLSYFQFPETSLVKTLVMKNTDKHL